jgi:hypothetical protein
MTDRPDRTVPCGDLIPDRAAPPRCYLGHPVPQQCPTCPDYTAGLNLDERTRCEVWTRVMGYHRPVAAFNVVKGAEHAEREYFREPSC